MGKETMDFVWSLLVWGTGSTQAVNSNEYLAACGLMLAEED